jgi:hypothetical protein
MARKKKQYTHLEMEAALCVWECLIDWTINEDDTLIRKDWSDLREAVGSVEMRHQSIVLGKWCLEIYDILTKHDKDFFDSMAYDWEVIPKMLGYACDAEGKPVIYEEGLPSPHRVAQMVAQDVIFLHFVWDCERQAEKQWCYRDLISDHDDKVEIAFAAGDEPAAFVKALGEDYDLIKF